MSEPKRQNPPAELFGEFSERLRGDRWQPGIDIFETEKAVVVRAEIAGVRREDVRVTVDDDLLRISGSRRAPSRTDVRRLHQMEIACGPFERAIRITIPFDRDQVAAHLEDGVLTVTLPRRVPASRQLDVEP